MLSAIVAFAIAAAPRCALLAAACVVVFGLLGWIAELAD